MNRDANLIGRKVAKLRFQREWTQDTFVAKLQVRFPDLKITRDIIANIETSVCLVRQTRLRLCHRHGCRSRRTLSAMNRHAKPSLGERHGNPQKISRIRPAAGPVWRATTNP